MSTDLYLYGTWGIKNIHAKSLNPFSQLNFFNLDSNAVADVIHYPKKTLLREISYLASCLQSPTNKKGDITAVCDIRRGPDVQNCVI